MAVPNVIDFETERKLKREEQKKYIGTLEESVEQGVRLDADLIVLGLDPTKDCRVVKEWAIKQRHCSDKEWAGALRKHRIKTVLDSLPMTAGELVQAIVKKQGIKFHYNGSLSRNAVPRIDGEIIPADLLAEKPLMRNMTAILCPTRLNTEELALDLQIANTDLNIGMGRKDIDDALNKWILEESKKVLSDLFIAVAYTPGDKSAEWKTVVEAAFDLSETSAEFVAAILQKSMWQVKRHMCDLEVTNHLMAVLLGPQGCGKTTFMKAMIEILADAAMNVDFNEATDNRNIELWRNFILFFDEMGHASKSDTDAIKNIITSEWLTRRPMTTNRVVKVRNNATFFGCSNKELDQLIRDETGLRRFIGLRFRHDPDRAVINSTNWPALWSSVNENGEDPSKPFLSEIAARQQEARVRSPVEDWVSRLDLKKDRPWFAEDLFKEYREWEQDNYPKLGTDKAVWGKELTRLIKTQHGFPFQKKTKDGYPVYVWQGRTAP